MLMRRIALMGLLSFFALAPSALASVVLAPPGHDGANQYVEVIPTSGGNAAPPGTARGSGSATGSPSALAGLGRGRGTDVRLSKMGKDGQAAAALAAATAPTPVAGGTGAGPRQTAGGSRANGGSANTAAASTLPRVPTSSPGGSAVDGIASALSGSGGGGLGLLLPLLLVTALVVILGGFTGLRLLSARHRQQPGS